MRAKRRGNNEGSIYQRKDGRWVASTWDDKGRRRSFYGRTRPEVAERLADALAKVQGGQILPKERQTVAQYLESWLETSARPRVRVTTYGGYERMIRLHVVPGIGKVRLARLTPQTLSHLYGGLAVNGLSPKSVRLVHAVLHRAFKQAVRWRLINVNPADAVDAPRAERKEFHALDAEETARLLEAARADRLHGVYVLAVTCGMRQGELLGLRWADVDLDKGALAVRQQVMRIGGEWRFSEPKTKAGRRVITLPAVAVSALREHRRRQAEERLRVGPEWHDNGLVFTNRIGNPIEKQNLMRRSFWPLLDRAALPRIRFHDLRHTAATLLLAEGLHPKVVQERLGHSTIAVTMDVYSHVGMTLQREAADTLDRLFAVRP